MHQMLQSGQAGFEFGDAGFPLCKFLIQPLDRRQSDTIGIHRAYMFVVGPDSEGGMEILRHGADVADGIGLGFHKQTTV